MITGIFLNKSLCTHTHTEAYVYEFLQSRSCNDKALYNIPSIRSNQFHNNMIWLNLTQLGYSFRSRIVCQNQRHYKLEPMPLQWVSYYTSYSWKQPPRPPQYHQEGPLSLGLPPKDNSYPEFGVISFFSSLTLPLHLIVS